MSDVEKNSGTHKPEFDGEWVRLGDVCEIVNGATPRTEVPEYWGGDIKWVTPAELRNEINTVFDTAKHLTKAGFESASLRMMPAGTILLTTRAPIGKLALAGDEMCCNQGFKCLICPETVNNEWLCRLMKHRVPELQAMGTGATFKELSKRAISDYKICVPPMEAQIDIVKKLTKLDEALANCRTLLSALDDLVKSQFVEMFGDGEWTSKTIGELATDIRFGTSKKATECGKYTYLRMNNLTDDGKLAYDDVKYIDLFGDELEKCQVVDGDLLFNRTNSREKVGKTAVFHGDASMVIAGYIIRVRLGEEMRSDYLSVFMNLSTTKAMLRSIAKGAVHQANVNSKELAAIKVPVAPIELQDRFLDFVARVDKLAFDVRQQIDKLEILKKSLMQEYFG